VSERMRVENGVEGLPKAHWEDLVHGHPELGFEVLKTIAHTATRPLHLQSFSLEDDSGLAAGAICEAVIAPGSRNRLDDLLFGRTARMAQSLGISSRPALLFMAPLGNGSSVIARRADGTEQRRLLHRLLDGIEDSAAARELGIAFIGVPEDAELLIETLRLRAYLESESWPTSRLDIEWSGFDAYVNHLRRRSKGAARTARNERDRNRRNGVTIRQLDNRTVDADAMYSLYCRHYRYKNGSDPIVGPQFFPRFLKAIGDDLLVFEANREGQRVGILGVVRSGSVGWVAWVGIEQRDRPNDFTYANLCFYHLADCAQTLGLRTLHYGNSALQAKRIRGCWVINNRLFYRPAGNLARVLLRPYLGIHRRWYRRKLR